MAIIDIIGAFSASGLLGGVTGLIGNELKSRRELKMIRLEGELQQASWPERQKERDHENAVAARNLDHEIKLHEINANASKEESERKILADEVSNSGAGLLAAMDADKAPEATAAMEYRFVGAIRSLVRPAALLVLFILTAFIFCFSPADVRAKIAAAVVYMTATAVLYYYGDRPSSGMKKMLLGGPL